MSCNVREARKLQCPKRHGQSGVEECVDTWSEYESCTPPNRTEFPNPVKIFEDIKNICGYFVQLQAVV